MKLIFWNARGIASGGTQRALKNMGLMKNVVDPPSVTSCQDFQRMCSDCSLLDVPTSGLSYTWTNRRTFVRLDRALGNLAWFESWQSLKCRTLTMSSSDHCPILVTCDKMVGISKPPFRFQGMWLLHPNFISLLHDFWDNHQVVGCPMFVLATKLRALKSMLKEWNFNVFGDINQQVNLSKLELDLVQNEISSMGPSALRFHREDLAHSKFQSALSMQDTFLRTKARVRWLVDGDRNTSFLHNMIKIRRLHQSLSSLRLGSVVITDSQQIINHTVTHFKSAFTMDPNILNTGLVERVIPNLVTLEENIGLTSMPSAEEIYTTLMTMDGSSAPSPDGFGGCFFQNCWNVVAQEINIRISHIFREGNTIADKLANYGAMNEGSIWWRMLPGFLRPSFGNDLESRTSYRVR
ncbi:hypothetical protein M0R45_002183 [Rubus argutus]|uniref:Uncharacterized protein n=1 Tax=Rubus argutus TaxID=59490 RepID=A0AAW1VR52_RUBAR